MRARSCERGHRLDLRERRSGRACRSCSRCCLRAVRRGLPLREVLRFPARTRARMRAPVPRRRRTTSSPRAPRETTGTDRWRRFSWWSAKAGGARLSTRTAGFTGAAGSHVPIRALRPRHGSSHGWPASSGSGTMRNRLCTSVNGQGVRCWRRPVPGNPAQREVAPTEDWLHPPAVPGSPGEVLSGAIIGSLARVLRPTHMQGLRGFAGFLLLGPGRLRTARRCCAGRLPNRRWGRRLREDSPEDSIRHRRRAPCGRPVHLLDDASRRRVLGSEPGRLLRDEGCVRSGCAAGVANDTRSRASAERGMLAGSGQRAGHVVLRRPGLPRECGGAWSVRRARPFAADALRGGNSDSEDGRRTGREGEPRRRRQRLRAECGR